MNTDNIDFARCAEELRGFRRNARCFTDYGYTFYGTWLYENRDALLAALDLAQGLSCPRCAQGVCSAHQPAQGVIAALSQRAQAAEAKLARVRALHQPYDGASLCGECYLSKSDEDDTDEVCPTIAALADEEATK